MSTHLPTEPYKGTRDFYPEDMAIQQYIFNTWAKTAELFGYERYDASILEPSELYRSKGTENEEMVNEQTYTFIDRGDREVTLRPEMTPSAARMIAARRRELSFPVRWYSIPNLFRYERPQRGRLREHWQLNCDLFGVHDTYADIELIMLAHHTFMSFGAAMDMFEIRVNDRTLMENWYKNELGLTDAQVRMITQIVDRKHKVSGAEFKHMLAEVVEDVERVVSGLEQTDPQQFKGSERLVTVLEGLQAFGITNVVFDPTIARGFNYYTGIVFEVFDTNSENKRSMMGGGRYDNLTTLFGGDPIPGVGFGMGDVIMRDFLETHKLMPKGIHVTAPTLLILPTDATQHLEALKIAQAFRDRGIRSTVDLSDKKLGKKISAASDAGVQFVLVVGDEELESRTFTLKELRTKSEQVGTVESLIDSLNEK